MHNLLLLIVLLLAHSQRIKAAYLHLLCPLYSHHQIPPENSPSSIPFAQSSSYLQRILKDHATLLKCKFPSRSSSHTHSVCLDFPSSPKRSTLHTEFSRSFNSLISALARAQCISDALFPRKLSPDSILIGIEKISSRYRTSAK